MPAFHAAQITRHRVSKLKEKPVNAIRTVALVAAVVITAVLFGVITA